MLYLVLIMCGLVIARALYAFLWSMRGMSRGKCCGGCGGCPAKESCPSLNACSAPASCSGRRED